MFEGFRPDTHDKVKNPPKTWQGKRNVVQAKRNADDLVATMRSSVTVLTVSTIGMTNG